jgi:DMSO/TMAO reductase YedYZ molybdopterin-dependent catalytic subunit
MTDSASVLRRNFLQSALLGAGGLLTACGDKRTPNPQTFDRQQQDTASTDWYSTADTRPLIRFPGKQPMILLTDRPPQIETPLRYFQEDFTPNDAYFVRWHVAGIPTNINVDQWKLQVSGLVNRPMQFSIDDLKRNFEPVSLTAFNQCSGNSRGFFRPYIPGSQWRHGAMGNAKWVGVRLKDVLDRAGVKPGSVEVSFRGLDVPPLSATPVIQRALPVDQARDGEILIAYEMNGQPLPLLNGFPVRLVVPGWYATWWIKSLTYITVLEKPLHNFWMDTAYRIPNNATAVEMPNHLNEDTVPINKFSVHSIFVSPEPGQVIDASRAVAVQGLAMDSGAGIKRVEFSSDGGQSWSDATLDPDLGRYSWRRWRTNWNPPRPGVHRFMVRATSNSGQMQLQSQWNHGGYQRSVIEHMDLRAV